MLPARRDTPPASSRTTHHPHRHRALARCATRLPCKQLPSSASAYAHAANSSHTAIAKPIPTFIAAAATRPSSAPVATRVAVRWSAP